MGGAGAPGLAYDILQAGWSTRGSVGSHLEMHSPIELPVMLDVFSSALPGVVATGQPLVASENLKCGKRIEGLHFQF